MTMPKERTRSLRFGWEFLIELQSSDNLTDKQRSTIEHILRHYPSGSEIKQWAKDCAGANEMFDPKILPEDLEAFRSQNPAIPDAIPRGPTTPAERTVALLSAFQLFQFGLLDAGNLTDIQKRQIPFVLRHFPKVHEINQWAKMDAWLASENPAFKSWLVAVPMGRANHNCSAN